MAVTPLLQSHVLEFSNALPFGSAMELLKSVLRSSEVNSSQAQRLVQYFGNLEQMESILQKPGFCLDNKTEEDILYVEVDGGHILTDEGYRETKVGRLFGGQHIVQVSSSDELVDVRNKLECSDYIAHYGHYKDFVERLNPLIKAHLQQNPKTKLVAVSDGAEWIEGWLNRDFPEAQCILDFYHACEKVCEFAGMIFSSSQRKQQWIDERKKELLDGKLEKLILAIRTKASSRRKAIREKAESVIHYYQNNKHRMQYDQYRQLAYCIGSGAIESAISTVVQQRCKLVGQRWTKRVQAVLNLRAAFKSNKKAAIRKLINNQMYTKSAA